MTDGVEEADGAPERGLEPDPGSMAVFCPTCEDTVICQPRGWTYGNYDPREGIPERWTLVQCPKDHVMLILQERLYFGMSFNEDSPHRMYPPRDRQLSTDIPSALRQTHDEARRCFQAKAFTAAVVMSGRTLEGACALHGVKEKTLQGSLQKMKQKDLIDGRLWDWAETLREVRNAAAHYDEAKSKISRQDAEDSLAFSEALLDYLYVLTKRFEALKERRATPETGASRASS